MSGRDDAAAMERWRQKRDALAAATARAERAGEQLSLLDVVHDASLADRPDASAVDGRRVGVRPSG